MDIKHSRHPTLLIQREGVLVGDTDRDVLGKALAVYFSGREATLPYKHLSVLSDDGRILNHAFFIDVTGLPESAAMRLMAKQILPPWLPKEVCA